MIDLETILTKYNFPKRTRQSQTTFEEIENNIGFPLPNDYKFYLENYEGYEEFIGPELVSLWDFDEILTSNTEYDIFRNLPKTLAIGSNPSSEFIGIEFVRKDKYRVVLSPFIDLSSKYHIDIGESL